MVSLIGRKAVFANVSFSVSTTVMSKLLNLTDDGTGKLVQR